MCGIAGYISKKSNIDIEAKVKLMTDSIKHRGPDGEGVKLLDYGVCFGHRRLAILDLSEEGLQPMIFQDRYSITYNGEIYNYIEIRKELEKKGIVFKTKTDTEVLLAAYSVWGESCVSQFNGMWAFAIYDKEEKKLFCSRDRYGVKPFYYEISDDIFIFGSEIKEILQVKEQSTIKANRDNLIAFLCAGIIDANKNTMFEGIEQLEGGFNLVLDCCTMKKHIYQYYDLSSVKVNRNSKYENYKLFNDKFFNSIKLRLRADVPVGSCLSGGLDSSAIVCAVHEQLKRTNSSMEQYTVSSCFNDKRYDEQEYIDAVVKHTGAVSSKVFPKMDEVFEQLDRIIWHMDEPFGSTSIFAQWCVFKTAKEKGLTVMLDGQGSDEQLAGYTPFYKVLFVDLLKRGKFKKLTNEIKSYKAFRSSSESEKTWKLLVSVILTTLCPDSFRYRLNSVYRKRKVSIPFPDDFYDNKIIKESWNMYDKRNPQKYINTGLHKGMRALLHYEDRDSMAHSIESRVPFLDYELTEFIYSVPMEQKIEAGKTKNLLREGLRDILPEEIYSRYSKLGFVTPEDQWIKNNEEKFLIELEKACDVLKDLINKEQVLSWYKVNVQKTRRGDSTCFRIICAARWAKVFGVTI